MANFTLNSTTLGVLGGAGSLSYAENIIGDRGRAITVDWTQTGLDQDFEMYGFSIRFAPAETEPKEVL